MNTPTLINDSLASSAAARPPGAPGIALPATPRSLLDLMSDGFYLLLLLKRGRLPTDAEAFTESIRKFLETVERGSLKLGIAGEDVYAARYAYCAAVDEAILTQPSAMRDTWERKPLQLVLFGDHLAGENFFARLEELRAQGAVRLQALEVYYFCLLLGFEGKYRIEGPEKLGYLSARLGDEIAYLKGRRAPFAPHWEPPDNVMHTLRRQVPLWAPAAVLGAFGLAGFFVFDTSLSRHTEARLAEHNRIVEMPPKTAHLTITLP